MQFLAGLLAWGCALGLAGFAILGGDGHKHITFLASGLHLCACESAVELSERLFFSAFVTLFHTFVHFVVRAYPPFFLTGQPSGYLGCPMFTGDSTTLSHDTYRIRTYQRINNFSHPPQPVYIYIYLFISYIYIGIVGWVWLEAPPVLGCAIPTRLSTWEK